MLTEQQLETWARHVQPNKNKETYDRVKGLFSGATFNHSNNYEVYLQGSVANHTNIYADGDIDIVLQYNRTYYYEYDYNPSIYHNPSDYTPAQFRNEVVGFLRQNGIPHQEKNKCIKLNIRGSQWQDVDLIPAFQYRNHWGAGRDQFHEGMKVQPLSGGLIINYPKLHKANGESKNHTAGNYKKVVRIFKNIKKVLVDNHAIGEKLAPSYFVECLVYNMPNEMLRGGNFQIIVDNCIYWLNNANLPTLKCQNGMIGIFGGESTQWDLGHCRTFINKVTEYFTK